MHSDNIKSLSAMQWIAQFPEKLASVHLIITSNSASSVFKRNFYQTMKNSEPYKTHTQYFKCEIK